MPIIKVWTWDMTALLFFFFRDFTHTDFFKFSWDLTNFLTQTLNDKVEENTHGHAKTMNKRWHIISKLADFPRPLFDLLDEDKNKINFRSPITKECEESASGRIHRSNVSASRLGPRLKVKLKSCELSEARWEAIGPVVGAHQLLNGTYCMCVFYIKTRHTRLFLRRWMPKMERERERE